MARSIRTASGGYVLVYDKPFGDFVLKCDVKMDQPFCNSGIFVRIGDLKDPVQSGLEVQVITDKKPGPSRLRRDLRSRRAVEKRHAGPGKWDAVEIRCEGPKIAVTVNGENVSSINCDEWREPGKRPDGTANKFKKAIKDFPRKGYIGLQDHGYNAWFKNIKLLVVNCKRAAGFIPADSADTAGINPAARYFLVAGIGRRRQIIGVADHDRRANQDQNAEPDQQFGLLRGAAPLVEHEPHRFRNTTMNAMWIDQLENSNCLPSLVWPMP